ncbi:efflux RND transporter permease subunit [Mesorhizobium sp. M7D.F.Ca.US.005.01.1.1]|uniref:efflux RND transporter permease subunit n=1 Tax=Mesorhizobium sp. M7D.F.Ca.US.005.01.1.1 TaxID=2493678 RepID=UPI001FE00268|nr:efflux RND transporter permease subunit [Mesorhizobium sp. M7D.F.Ca.US.005.01.1.1]
MTALAFILGVLPLATSTGGGRAGARQAVGVTIIGCILAARLSGSSSYRCCLR